MPLAKLLRWREPKKDAAAVGTKDDTPLPWPIPEVKRGLVIGFAVRLYRPDSKGISEGLARAPEGLSRPVFSRFLHLAL